MLYESEPSHIPYTQGHKKKQLAYKEYFLP